MGTLHRWSILLAFVTGIFACTQKSAPGFKPNSEPDGFAGIKWATEFSEVKSDMIESRSISNPTEPDVKIKIFYTKKGDNLRMGECQPDKIEYGFWKGKFAEVRITASGPENFDHLKKVLFEKYGPLDKPLQGAYSWFGSVTQIFLRVDESANTSLLTIASTKIANQQLQEMIDND